MSQQVSTLESASFGFDDGAGVMGGVRPVRRAEGVAERHTCLVLRLARARSEVWPVAARPRGHLDDGKRQIARTGWRSDAVADLVRWPRTFTGSVMRL
jgi:hypothetical protein